MSMKYRKVAFLDTNALHYVDLYLKYAKDASMYPFVDKKMDDDNAVAEAKTRLADLTGTSLKESLGHGLNVLSWISKTDAKVEYSPITDLELMVGRLKGKALEAAAGEGVPDRMWSRFHADEKEVSVRLTPEDLEKTMTGVLGLRPTLEDAGVVTANVAREQEVLDLAKHLVGLVYMSVADCIVYSHALAAQANYLITNDTYLRNTVNRIRSKTSHRKIKARIREIVRQTTATLGDSSDVVLPEAKWPKDRRSSDSSKSDA